MSHAVAAREHGDDYQKLVFWIYVNKMLKKHSEIKEIGYEYDEVKSMDDVVVIYSNPQIDNKERNIYRDYIQVKFHMRQEDFFTFDNLLDPEFIGATKYSALDKLVTAYRQLGNDFNKSRFILYSQWDIKQTDELYNLVSNVNRAIELDKLFTNGSRSKMGKLRQKLCSKLNVTEAELKAVFAQLRLYTGQDSIERLIDCLNKEFLYNGLKPCHFSKVDNPYIHLISSWMKAGIKIFNKEFILDECKKEGLLDANRDIKRIAVCSFTRNTEYLEHETESVLNLNPFFNGRFLANGKSWEDIYSYTEKYIRDNLKFGCEYQIYLETHLSISFLAGRILNTKSGIFTIPIQKSIEGWAAWKHAKSDRDCYENLIIEKQIIDYKSYDSAIAIGLSNHIIDDVWEYIENEKINIGVLFSCRLLCAGPAAVVDGEHAWRIVEQVNDCIESRNSKEKRGTLHIFAATPSAIMFNLGKLSLSYGKIVLYDFDFQRIKNGSYYKTMSFPVEGEY